MCKIVLRITKENRHFKRTTMDSMLSEEYFLHSINLMNDFRYILCPNHFIEPKQNL